jgi:alkylhydroperoxidase family enzyme
MSKQASASFFAKKEAKKLLLNGGRDSAAAAAHPSLRAQRSNPGSRAVAVEPGFLRVARMRATHDARNDEFACESADARSKSKVFWLLFFKKVTAFFLPRLKAVA